MIVKIAVLQGSVHVVENVPAGSTVEYVAQKAGVGTGGQFKINGAEVTLDTQVSDGQIILMLPSSGKVAGANQADATDEVEEVITVSFSQPSFLVKDAVAVSTMTVGEYARNLGLPACGTEITLNGAVVSRADKLTDGANYEVKAVPCGDESEDEDCVDW